MNSSDIESSPAKPSRFKDAGRDSTQAVLDTKFEDRLSSRKNVLSFTDRPKCEHTLNNPIQICISYFNKRLPSSGTRKDLDYNNIRTRCGTTVSPVSGRRHYGASKSAFL